jgi:single-strand DNA-binding protein
MNVVVLRGALSSAPIARELPSGSVLYSLEVTTRTGDGSAMSVPVVCVDPRRPLRHQPGDEVAVVGVVRRRFYRSGAGVQSRTEVLAERVVAVRRASDVERILTLAAEKLAG